MIHSKLIIINIKLSIYTVYRLLLCGMIKPASDRQRDSNRDDDDNTENDAEHNKHNTNYGQ